MTNAFERKGIDAARTINDVEGEIAALPEQERMRAAQDAYNALNSEETLRLAYQRENHSLDNLISEFNARIAYPLIEEGKIFSDSDFDNPINHEAYVIRRGDTLEGIASRQGGLNADYIAKHNGIADSNVIRAGDTIQLPTNKYIDRIIRRDVLLDEMENDPWGVSIPPHVRDFTPETGFPNLYGRFGSMQALQQAGSAEYLRLVDQGYARGIELWDAGKMPKQSFDWRLRNRDIGNYMDRFARQGMNEWFGNERIAMGRDGAAQVYVNRHLRSISGLNYVVPDIRIGDRIYDASLQRKSETTRQVRNFYRFGNPSMVTIVQPTALGGLYDIPRPPGL